MPEFVHLHVHSQYSLLDGAIRLPDLAKQTSTLGMKAIALTDHGNLFGSMEFYQTAKEQGVRPILGMEAYIAPRSRTERDTGREDSSYHLVLLAMNAAGWANLMRLSSRAFLEGFYYRPRIDFELLDQFNEGLVCTTACLGGAIPHALKSDQPDRARALAGRYLDIFGRDRFFIEVQNQGEADQTRINPLLIALAREMNIGLVGTNDVHFLRREDHRSHAVLTCISTGKKMAEAGAMSYSPELYLKSPDEMAAAFKDFPAEVLTNTVRIAEMCRAEPDFKKHLPKFKTPDGSPPDTYLERAATEGLRRRFKGNEPPEDYRKRLAWELKVIRDKGYSSYFLIVNDFVQFARRNGIPAGPRGSGVATLLGYSLGIANVDPLRFGLLFERFTDPQRQEDPDIDIDLCQDGRGRVIQYVREKYGHVAQIITYGRLKARAVVRDVGRVLGWPIEEVNALAKLIPEAPKASLGRALGLIPAKDDDEKKLFSSDFKSRYQDEPRTRELVDHALTLEGLARHAGVHAAGVIVCDEPLVDLIPLCRVGDNPDAITQWEHPVCERAGMMKMDFLGLRTLSILQRTRDLVRQRTGEDIDPETLTYDDPAVFDLIRRAETEGVFQLSSAGMRNVLRKMQPTRIEDLIAANAMFRPGPMDLIDTYCQRKNGRQKVEKIHDLVDGLLAETYGIMIYQEQVMQVLNKLGKLPLNRALSLIKAISKKKAKVIESERPNFFAGAKENGIDEAEAGRLFDLILKFAGYGFNKAHSTSYAIIAYQAAWFKVHHPREFMAATLTYESVNLDNVVIFMNEARRMGIEIAPPDINTGESRFAVDGERVRFGLQAVKGVGEAAVEAILAARREGGPFTSLFDFCRRVDLRAVNRATIEALVKCGAFDRCGGPHRRATLEAIERAMAAGQAAHADRASGQMSLFGDSTDAHETALEYPAVPPWPPQEQLALEKATLGFYVSAHPLMEFFTEVESLAWPASFHLGRLEIKHAPAGSEEEELTGDGEESDEVQRLAGLTVATAALITGVRELIIKSGKSAGKKMAALAIEDLNGRCEAVVFSATFEKYKTLLTESRLVYLWGEVDLSRGRPQIMVEGVVPLEQAAENSAARVTVHLQEVDLEPARVVALADLLKRHPGTCPVFLNVHFKGEAPCRATVIEPGRTWTVAPAHALIQALQAHAGPRAVRLEAKPPPRRKPRYSGPPRGT